MTAILPPPDSDQALATAGMLCHFVASDPAMTETFRVWIEHHPGDLDAAQVVSYLCAVHDLLSPECEGATFDFRPERRMLAGAAGALLRQTARRERAQQARAQRPTRIAGPLPLHDVDAGIAELARERHKRDGLTRARYSCRAAWLSTCCGTWPRTRPRRPGGRCWRVVIGRVAGRAARRGGRSWTRLALEIAAFTGGPDGERGRTC